jgi:hypothetical protein
MPSDGMRASHLDCDCNGDGHAGVDQMTAASDGRQLARIKRASMKRGLLAAAPRATRRRLAAGGWWLVAGGWWLVAGGWQNGRMTLKFIKP